jgi:hypothetical protein
MTAVALCGVPWRDLVCNAFLEGRYFDYVAGPVTSSLGAWGLSIAWTGSEVVLWSGATSNDTPTPVGGRYQPPAP